MKTFEAAGPILWVRRIYADGRHNAFTALVRWRGFFWLAFRSGESHRSYDGRIFLLTSPDGREWSEAHRIEREGDDRDPHLFVVGDRLVLIVNQRHPDRRDIWATFSDDGERWADLQPCYERGFIIWKPKALHGALWAVAHHVGPDGGGRYANLITSDDGLAWRTVATISRQGHESETVLHAPAPDRLVAFIRRHADPWTAQIAEAQRPFTAWEIRDTDVLLQGHDYVTVGDALVMGSRFKDGPPYVTKFEAAGTCLYRYADGRFERFATLPSGGDTSYPGFARTEEDVLLMSYYSSHEGPANVYLAAVDVSALRG